MGSIATVDFQIDLNTPANFEKGHSRISIECMKICNVMSYHYFHTERQITGCKYQNIDREDLSQQGKNVCYKLKH